jgi:hypothetical protein
MLLYNKLHSAQGDIRMGAYWRAIAMAFVTVASCLALGAPAQARCVLLSGTADGFDKETAIGRAQSALAEEVTDYKTLNRLGAVTVSAMRASPNPYWRTSVSNNMLCFNVWCGIYKPDIVKSSSYTTCWSGVVSPYVCTSGAKLCW